MVAQLFDSRINPCGVTEHKSTVNGQVKTPYCLGFFIIICLGCENRPGSSTVICQRTKHAVKKSITCDHEF